MSWLRRLVVLILGLVLVADTLVNQFRPVEFAIGVVMIGLIPIDTVIDLVSRPTRDEAEITRLRQAMTHEPDSPPDPEP